MKWVDSGTDKTSVSYLLSKIEAFDGVRSFSSVRCFGYDLIFLQLIGDEESRVFKRMDDGTILQMRDGNYRDGNYKVIQEGRIPVLGGCPFCGSAGEFKVSVSEDGRLWHYVGCTSPDCGCQTVCVPSKKEAEAIWNKILTGSAVRYSDMWRDTSND